MSGGIKNETIKTNSRSADGDPVLYLLGAGGLQMTPVNEVLIRYINRLEDDIQRLNKEASAHRSNPCGTDIKKAIHDASNMLGLLKTYKITDPDIVAVEFIQEVVRYMESKR